MTTQPNVAFIVGHSLLGERLEAALLEEAERFIGQGRRNLVLIVDTFLSYGEAAVAAIASLLHRAAELQAELTCVALDERAVAVLRAHPQLASLRVIRRVDQIR
jgi:hypothetical protein